MLPRIINQNNYRKASIGSKARTLFEMRSQGLPVPACFCISEEAEQAETEAYLAKHFPDTVLFSVRSAAFTEDQESLSFAGQFSTYLNVHMSDCYETAQRVFQENDRAIQYMQAQGRTENLSKCVILQKMIPAQFSGVLFTVNPVGAYNEMVIAVGKGTGDGVVEDKTPVTSYYYNRTDQLYHCESAEGAPLLSEDQVEALVALAKRAEKLYEKPLDLEFAIYEEQLYLLQARPITGLDLDAETVVLDSSNIVESYPGLSLPLTQSFVQYIYYRVFRGCVLRLTRSKKTTTALEPVLRHMVEAVNGHIYYRISNWYDVLRILPFSGRIIPIWQEMLGVREKTVSHSAAKPSLFVKLQTLLSFLELLKSTPKRMRRLNTYFQDILQSERWSAHRSAAEALQLYHKLEQRLGDEWDITLANDMYTFLFTAMLKKRTGDQEANRLIAGNRELESLQPVRMLEKMSDYARSNELCDALKRVSNSKQFTKLLAEWPLLEKQVDAYIQRYGDRGPEELKLETKTYRTDPYLLAAQIVSFSDEKALPEKETALNERPKGRTGFLLKRAMLGTANRETSRMNRSRVFGVVRQLLTQAGEELVSNHRLEAITDIYYLTIEELEQAVYTGTDFRNTVQERKLIYAYYQELPSYTRLVFKGKVREKPIGAHVDMIQAAAQGKLSGTPCAGGTVYGEVLVVHDIANAGDARGRIIVAESTDPGWVFLIARAKGIIVERGSLLSHTAIVTRELKKPCVVGVPNATKQLHSGDWIRLDGDTGHISLTEEPQNRPETKSVKRSVD